MAQAFLAQDADQGLVRLVRIHAPDESLINACRLRFRRVHLIQHANVLAPELVSHTDHELIFATRYVHEQTLETLPIETLHAWHIIEGVTSALSAAHSKGVWHGCLSNTAIYRDPSDPARVFIDPMDLMLQSSHNMIAHGDPQKFADDILQLGNLLLEWLGPNQSDTATNRQLFELVEQMTLEDWASRLSIQEVHTRVVRLQKSSLTLQDDSNSASDMPTMAVDGDAIESMASDIERDRMPTSIGRFVIERHLGEGGMGTVLLGRDPTNEQSVAIKVLADQWVGNERSMRRFEREARHLAGVSHPAIAQLIEFGQAERSMYLAMEFVPGGCLADFTRTQEPCTEALAIQLIADAARGLEAAHAVGLVHRDIKPANLLLTQRGKRSLEKQELDPSLTEPLVKVADFGLAKHYEASETLAMTQTGMILGTPLYMSPEQCRGEAIGPQADVYSLGVTLFQCLTGKTPFTGQAPIEIFRKHCDEPVPSVRTLNSQVSDALQHIVEKSLSKNPALRYQNAGELARDLENLLLGVPTAIALHPAVPDPTAPGQMRFQFQWKLRSAPEQVWPFVSNTDRVNHAVGLPAVQYRTFHDPKLGMRRMATVRAMGMKLEWEEHPFEWIEGRRLSVLRQFPSGPFHWFTNVVELQPQSDGGTLVIQTLSMLPRNVLGRLFARFEIGAKSERNFGRVYEKVDAYLQSSTSAANVANPFSTTKPLAKDQKRRLAERMARVRASASHIAPQVLDTLEQFFEFASDLDIARMRPLAFAERFGLPPDETVQACLLAAREGLLILLWDILCPTCRIPSDVQETLKGLADHGHCEACNADFELDFAQSIELIFRLHPEIRQSETKTYCVGGPAFSSHVVAQMRLQPDERLVEQFSLSEGQYRIRGPQLPFVIDFRVVSNGRVARWDIDLSKPPPRSSIPLLRSGEQVIAFLNPHGTPRQVRIERLASRSDALTAADAARLPAFREWFPDEVLSPGQMISLTTVTLLACRISNAYTLYTSLSEQAACTQLLKQLQAMNTIVQQRGGCTIKSMNDGLNTVFPDVASALQAALDMQSGANDANSEMQCAIHQGAAIVATINDRLDYYGQAAQYTDDLLRSSMPAQIWVSDTTWNESELSSLLQGRWKAEMRPPIAGWPQWNVLAVYPTEKSDAVSDPASLK
jgi:serine/threonine protein kinase/class 3 adenylate cyclase